MKTKILAAALLLVAHSADAAPRGAKKKAPKPASSMVLCQVGASGIVARPKCKAGETVLDLTKLISVTSSNVQPGPQGPAGPQGPQGPQGVPGPIGPEGLINLTSCHVVTNTSTANITAAAGAVCNQTDEFMLTWGWEYEGTALVVMREASLYYAPDGKVATGIFVISQTDFGTTLTGYTLIVNAVCCARN